VDYFYDKINIDIEEQRYENLFVAGVDGV